MATRDDFLSLLLRHSRKALPTTGVKYGGKDLKTMLDARKWNWIPGTRRGTKVCNKGEYFKRLPWFRAWIERATGKSRTLYSASAHTRHHELFKEHTSKLFAKRAKRVHSGIIVLDDFSGKRGHGLRTLGHLKNEKIKPRRIFIPNTGRRQCEAAQRARANSFHGLLEEALENDWADVKTGAAYLDTCSGSWKYVAGLIDSVLENANKRFFLAFTLLGRGVARADNTKESENIITDTKSIVGRLATIDMHLRKKGFYKIGKSDEEAVKSYPGKSLPVTVFYERVR